MSSNITVRTLMVVLRSGRTMPLYSAPESISHRLFCQGEYFPPLEFMQTPPFRVEFGCHISTIVPPQWEPIRPMGTIVCASKEVSKEVSKETQKRTESHGVAPRCSSQRYPSGARPGASTRQKTDRCC